MFRSLKVPMQSLFDMASACAKGMQWDPDISAPSLRR